MSFYALFFPPLPTSSHLLFSTPLQCRCDEFSAHNPQLTCQFSPSFSRPLFFYLFLPHPDFLIEELWQLCMNVSFSLSLFFSFTLSLSLSLHPLWPPYPNSSPLYRLPPLSSSTEPSISLVGAWCLLWKGKGVLTYLYLARFLCHCAFYFIVLVCISTVKLEDFFSFFLSDIYFLWPEYFVPVSFLHFFSLHKYKIERFILQDFFFLLVSQNKEKDDNKLFYNFIDGVFWIE